MLGLLGGMGLGLPGEMLGCIPDKVNEAILHVVMKVQVKGGVYFILGKIADDTGHEFEISKAPVCGIFHVGVICAVLIELFDAWKTKRGIDIGGGRVMPQADIQINDFFPHDRLIGVLGGDFELKKNGGQVSQGLGNLGGAVLPVGCGKLGESIQCAPVKGLESFNLCFDGRQGYFDARFGVFSLRVEVDSLPDSDNCEDD